MILLHPKKYNTQKLPGITGIVHRANFLICIKWSDAIKKQIHIFPIFTNFMTCEKKMDKHYIDWLKPKLELKVQRILEKETASFW